MQTRLSSFSSADTTFNYLLQNLDKLHQAAAPEAGSTADHQQYIKTGNTETATKTHDVNTAVIS